LREGDRDKVDGKFIEEGRGRDREREEIEDEGIESDRRRGVLDRNVRE